MSDFGFYVKVTNIGRIRWRSVVLDRSYLGTRNKTAVMEIENWSKYISGKARRKIKVKRFIRLYVQKKCFIVCVYPFTLRPLLSRWGTLSLFLSFFLLLFFLPLSFHTFARPHPRLASVPLRGCQLLHQHCPLPAPARYPSGTPSLCPLVSATLSASCVRRPQGRREGSEAVIGTGT